MSEYNEQFLAAYCRLSLADGDLGVDGKDESNSIENQKALLYEFIESKEEFQGMEVREFVDDGYTGTNFKRPGFQKMIDLAKQGKVAAIIVKDLSRFGRDYIGVGEYMEQIFPLLGIRLIAINTGYDSKDYIGMGMGLDIAVSNLVNTMYSRDSGKKLRSANMVKWEKGYTTHASAPFGYIIDPDHKGRYKIDPPSAAIVRKIFDLALMDLNTTQIAYQLNKENVPIPSEYNRQHNVRSKSNQYILTPDKLWNANKVWNILREYAYTGAMVLGKRRILLSGTKITRKMPKEKWYITEGTHEAIVSHEEFEQAQSVIRFTSKREYQTKNEYALRKKIRCGHCNRVMQQNFNLNDPIVWCEDGRAMPEFSNCPSEAYTIKQIEWIAYRALKHMLFILRAIDGKIREADKEQIKWQKALVRKRQRTEQEVTLLKAERTKLYEAYASGSISLEEYKAQKAQVAVQIETMQMDLEKECADGVKDEIPAEVRQLARTAQDFYEEEELTKNAATAFIENVYVYRGAHIVVQFKFEDQIGQVMEKFHICLPEKKGGSECESVKEDWKDGFAGDLLSSYVHPAPC